MKNLKRISYIIISLILFQSYSVVANSLDFHAIDTQHLQQEHKHSEHKQVLDANGTSGKEKVNHNNTADCHHCGHCHGTHAQWVNPNNINGLKTVVSIHNFNYLDMVVDTPVNRLLRPPKVLSYYFFR